MVKNDILQSVNYMTYFFSLGLDKGSLVTYIVFSLPARWNNEFIIVK